MMYDPPKRGKAMKKPFDKREDKDKKKSFSKTEKSVKAVAKDTNKTRRRMVKPTKGQTI